MSGVIARITLRDAIKKRYLVSTPSILLTPSCTYMEAKNVEVDRNELRFDYDFVAGTKAPKPTHVSVLFKKWDYMKVLPYDRSGSYYYLATMGSFWAGRLNGSIFAWKTQTDAQRAADAINRLIYEAQLGPPPADDLTAFTAMVKGWQANPATVHPATEAINKYRILAEQGIKDGDPIAAITNYEAGVADSPVWAEGWFNAAIIYEQLGEFGAAADRMRRYLILMPDAPDAAAAREKLVVWDDKARKQ
jgi:hypothetical protein